MSDVTAWLGRVSGGGDLDETAMAAAVDGIMRGLWTNEQIGLFLMALRHKGETVDEIAGAARALRQHMQPVRSSRVGLVDTCGTGGDGSGTFNISTAAALVTAAAGVPVAKHGNRRITSRTGSADVLTALGVNVEADVPTVEGCLDRLGLGFCFAPLLHSAMRHVAEVRRQLGVPTIFNLLGPLSNPAGAPFQVLGVGKPALRPVLAEALVKLGTRRALVVSGDDGLDEVTLATTTQVSEATPAGVRTFVWEPADFGLERQSLAPLAVDSPAASAAMITRILAGEPGPARDIVLMNSAAALCCAGFVDSPRDGVARAAEAIDRGAARELLARLGQLTHAGRSG